MMPLRLLAASLRGNVGATKWLIITEMNDRLAGEVCSGDG